MTTLDPFSSAGPKAEDTREASAKRDGYGRYLIPKLPSGPIPPVGVGSKGDTAWTRATTFAKSISDTFILSAWSQRMAVKGLASRADLVMAAAACPISDKHALDSIVEQAKDAAAVRASANLGTAMHAFTEAFDRGEEPAVPAPYDRDIRAYAAVLAEHGITMLPGMMERTVVNDTFGIAGTFDRIVMYQGRPTVLDLKTGRDLQYGWNEIGIQLALYASADAIWDWDKGAFFPMPDGLDKTRALVIHLPVGQGRADLYEVELEPALEACTLCYHVRRWRKTRGLATLITVAAAPTPGAAIAETAARLNDIGKAAIRGAETAARNIADGFTGAISGGGPTPEVALAPFAGPGQKGCSVCRRVGHRKGSPKCTGPSASDALEPSDVLRAVTGLDDVAPVKGVETSDEKEWCVRTGPCSGAGWAAPSQDGASWVCGNCGKPSRSGQIDGSGVPVTGTIGMPATGDPFTVPEPAIVKAARAAERSGAPDEVVADAERIIEEYESTGKVEEVPDPFAELPVAVRPPTVVEKLNVAASKAEIRTIRDAALADGTWTPELQAIGIARLTKIAEPAG